MAVPLIVKLMYKRCCYVVKSFQAITLPWKLNTNIFIIRHSIFFIRNQMTVAKSDISGNFGAMDKFKFLKKRLNEGVDKLNNHISQPAITAL